MASGFRWHSPVSLNYSTTTTASLIEGIYYGSIHLGHSLIKLESLYRYLRKFHAFDERRYVLLSLRHIPAALVVLLSLEFMPRRRYLPSGTEIHAAQGAHVGEREQWTGKRGLSPPERRPRS